MKMPIHLSIVLGPRWKSVIDSVTVFFNFSFGIWFW